MDRVWPVIRFWVIPLISLVCTALLPISNPIVWVIWVGAAISVFDTGPSTMGMIRFPLWVGLHLLLICLL